MIVDGTVVAVGLSGAASAAPGTPAADGSGPALGSAFRVGFALAGGEDLLPVVRQHLRGLRRVVGEAGIVDRVE